MRSASQAEALKDGLPPLCAAPNCAAPAVGNCCRLLHFRAPTAQGLGPTAAAQRGWSARKAAAPIFPTAASATLGLQGGPMLDARAAGKPPMCCWSCEQHHQGLGPRSRHCAGRDLMPVRIRVRILRRLCHCRWQVPRHPDPRPRVIVSLVRESVAVEKGSALRPQPSSIALPAFILS